MGVHGELFPGKKLRHVGDRGAPEEEHDPGGALDLDSGIVFLAPPNQPAPPPTDAPESEADLSE